MRALLGASGDQWAVPRAQSSSTEPYWEPGEEGDPLLRLFYCTLWDIGFGIPKCEFIANSRFNTHCCVGTVRPDRGRIVGLHAGVSL